MSDEPVGPLERRLAYDMAHAMMSEESMAEMVSKGIAGEKQEGFTPLQDVVTDLVLPTIAGQRRAILALAREVDRLNAADPSDDPA